MSSHEREETLEEFLARMSDSLVTEEKDPTEKEMETSYKDRLVLSYFQQYYTRRRLEDIPSEARRFNMTFPLWKRLRKTNYTRMAERNVEARDFLTNLARLTGELERADARGLCSRMCDNFLSERQLVMPGTEASREIDSRIHFWRYIDEVVDYSGTLQGNNETLSQSGD